MLRAPEPRPHSLQASEAGLAQPVYRQGACAGHQHAVVYPAVPRCCTGPCRQPQEVKSERVRWAGLPPWTPTALQLGYCVAQSGDQGARSSSPAPLLLRPLALQRCGAAGAKAGVSGRVTGSAGGPHCPAPDGGRVCGFPAPQVGPHPTLGAAPRRSGVMLCSPPCLVPQQSPSTLRLAIFSCEELQDIDLELNVDNSAFYDQFAMAQVGGAARAGGRPASSGRGPFTAERSPSAQPIPPSQPGRKHTRS